MNAFEIGILRAELVVEGVVDLVGEKENRRVVGSEVVQRKEVPVRRTSVSEVFLVARKRANARAGVVVMIELEERLGASGESVGVGGLKDNRLGAIANNKLSTGVRAEHQRRRPDLSEHEETHRSAFSSASSVEASFLMSRTRCMRALGVRWMAMASEYS